MTKFAISAAVAAFGAFAASAQPAVAQDVLYGQKALTPEAALVAAQAAMGACREQGFQVAVAVVDRGGNPQTMVRDRFAGAHTADTAARKAYTAVSFRTDTIDLIAMTGPGTPAAGLRDLPGVAILGGGVRIEAGGTIVGGIGVSGSPGGDSDDRCARAGIDAIRAGLDF
ncbi:MAG: heme-binding protein [Alphaproteobacteria bacterium]|nr:heme-binding protein [Alphaproteobacteria bacterium]